MSGAEYTGASVRQVGVAGSLSAGAFADGKAAFYGVEAGYARHLAKDAGNDTAHARRGRLHHANALCGGPPRVEYALTARSETLRPILEELLAWAVDNMDAVMQDRRKAHASKDKIKRMEE